MLSSINGYVLQQTSNAITTLYSQETKEAAITLANKAKPMIITAKNTILQNKEATLAVLGVVAAAVVIYGAKKSYDMYKLNEAITEVEQKINAGFNDLKDKITFSSEEEKTLEELFNKCANTQDSEALKQNMTNIIKLMQQKAGAAFWEKSQSLDAQKENASNIATQAITVLKSLEQNTIERQALTNALPTSKRKDIKVSTR